MGDFFPTELGEDLMPVITGDRKAGYAFSRSCHRGGPNADVRGDALESTIEYADFAAATARFEALELELRAPDGTVIPTKDITINDCDWLIEIGEEAERRRELEGELYDELELGIEEWSPEESRFDQVDWHDPDLAEIHESLQAAENMLNDMIEKSMFETDTSDDPYADEPIPFPRFQLMVDLVDSASIP